LNLKLSFLLLAPAVLIAPTNPAHAAHAAHAARAAHAAHATHATRAARAAHTMRAARAARVAHAANAAPQSAQSGVASIYSTKDGLQTASGARMSNTTLTAAHRSLPFGSKVRVTNRSNGKTVVVMINDRGPFIRGRIIDLTPAAARALGFSGLARVTIERVV
jgi:rare lipoprotein A